MSRSRRPSRALLLLAVLALFLGATSCGGGGSSGSSDLVLVGFNVPNIAGVPLNQPLIFTFSNAIDPASITPDTLRVVGSLGPNFETTVVDGNLVALLPRSPNFEDYSDAGLLPGLRYTVSFAQYPAPATIRTTEGKPLLDAESFQFDTVPAPEFVEPRRPINHGLAPSQGGNSDDEGCLNNPDNSLDTSKQFGSDLGARLLCLKNEGQPQIILDECDPTHNDQAVGVPSAVTPGFVNLPALRVRFNEPLDPITVAPYVPTEKWGLNVQLWLVGDTNRIPLPPRQIRTNKPLLVQSLDQTEIILVAANEDVDGNPIGGVPQGTYLVNVTSALSDLPGLALDTSARPNPAIGGFQDVEDNVNGSGDVPPGYRMYFVTLVVPGTPQSITESFSTNLAEWGDTNSGTDEPGVFTRTDLQDPLDPGDDLLLARISGSLIPTAASPEYTLLGTREGIGQSTSANWNGAFRFFGLPGLAPNTDVSDGTGTLRPVFLPYLGDGGDDHFDSPGGGSTSGFSTEDGSDDNDGIYEFKTFNLKSGDIISVAGTKPLVILCQGDFTLDGTIEMVGAEGGPGLDTDGDPRYENPDSIDMGGAGGEAAPGGGIGGAGGDPVAGGSGVGASGLPFVTVFDTGSVAGGGGGAIDPMGGGGGGMVTFGQTGTFDDGTPGANEGPISTTLTLESLLADFAPDRGYSPNANGSGGTGGGGGGMNDATSNGTAENGDDGGGGGGGAGGGLYVIAGGTISIGGTIVVDGGAGGNTYAVSDQIVDLGADGNPGGTGEDADSVTGISPNATPSGAGGPGGGGSGGTIYLMGKDGVTFDASATVTAAGGAGGASGTAALAGGAGAEGVILLGSMSGAPISVNGSATVDPVHVTHAYQPTVDLASCGQSEWIDLFTPTGVFEKFSWTSNFAFLNTLGLVQGVDFDAILEVQGCESVSPIPADGAPATASAATVWEQINANSASESAVEFDGAPASPIDSKRYVRWRWRFVVSDNYPVDTVELPSIESFTIEFER